jgi:Fe-S cluster assembly iron-binding protein IscA
VGNTRIRRSFPGGCPGQYTFGPNRNLAEALVGYALAVYLCHMYRVLRWHQEQNQTFFGWLLENREAIKQGTASYEATPISEQTELAQYQAMISLILVRLEARSRFYIVGHESNPLTALEFTLCSLIMGWWDIPMGPVATIRSVISNVLGGKRTRISDVLAELTGHEKEVVHLTERAAENAQRIMTERGFPASTAVQLEVEGSPRSPRYRITYDDQPPTDGSVWRGASHGVTIVVRKKDEPRFEGLVVDFIDGEFTFKEGKRIYVNPDY